jgi:tetraacyldisaccharide 4'-kinase
MRAWLERRLNAQWYGEHSPGLLMRTLEGIYRRRLGEQWHRPKSRPPVPVIVIGNLTVGGGGKTPVVIALARALSELDLNVAVISRGYGGKATEKAVRVGTGSDPESCGDEPLLIARETRTAVWVCRQRSQALEAAVAAGAGVVLADDGLQHRRLPRSYEICVVDGGRAFGNGRLLPAGPLRQPLERLAEVDFILVKGAGLDLAGGIRFELQPGDLVSLDLRQREPAAAWSGQTVDAVCGISNPGSFFSALERLGMQVRPHPFPDHHDYTADDINKFPGPVVVTAKDAVKLERLALEPVVRKLETEARLPENLIEQIHHHIDTFYDDI